MIEPLYILVGLFGKIQKTRNTTDILIHSNLKQKLIFELRLLLTILEAVQD